MKRVVAYLRPHRLEDVKSALAPLPLTGLSVADARGTGDRPEKAVSLLGQALVISLPVRVRLETVVPDDLVEEVVATIVEAARTGAPGDGKIYVEEIGEAIKIRTGETGELAI